MLTSLMSAGRKIKSDQEFIEYMKPAELFLKQMDNIPDVCYYYIFQHIIHDVIVQYSDSQQQQTTAAIHARYKALKGLSPEMGIWAKYFDGIFYLSHSDLRYIKNMEVDADFGFSKGKEQIGLCAGLRYGFMNNSPSFFEGHFILCRMKYHRLTQAISCFIDLMHDSTTSASAVISAVTTRASAVTRTTKSRTIAKTTFKDTVRFFEHIGPYKVSTMELFNML